MFTNDRVMVASSALVLAIPDAQDRGAFMSINASLNMVSGGIASLIAGSIVYQTETGHFQNYILGYVVAAATLITIGLMYIINDIVMKKSGATVAHAH